MINLVADSSFYICFLDDIDCPNDLLHILKHFLAHIPPRVNEEISKCKNYSVLKNHVNFFRESKLDLGKLLEPFFSKDEKLKGEHEVVVLSIVLYNTIDNIVIIIDDKGPRKFLFDNFGYMQDSICGTVGFIGLCYYKYHIFEKQKSLYLLDKIENSNFRIKKEEIEEVRQKINEH